MRGSHSEDNTDIASTRPTTARLQTALSTRAEGNYVTALIESRGVTREIGIATLNRSTGRAILMQLADCQTYVKTINHLELHYPSTILVPDATFGQRQSQSYMLLQYIREEFAGVSVEPVIRKYWNEHAGLNFIDQLCVDDEDRAATLVSVSNKYYALSASCALFKHAESKLNIVFAPRSLKIRYQAVEGSMFIDSETAQSLELVNNIVGKKSSHSLLGLLDHTFTPMATRLVRLNILAPIVVRSSIEQRLDAVEEMVQTEDLFNGIREALKACAKVDFDKLIASIVQSQAREASSSKLASTRVSQMLNIRNLLKVIPSVCTSLHGARSDLLRMMFKMLNDSRLEKLEALISDSLNDDVAPNKGGGLSALNAKVYAVKANLNRLLDVSRETFKENVGDIIQLSNQLSEEHGFTISPIFQESGFIFSTKKTEVQIDFPREFINLISKGQKWLFSSVELKKRNARLKDALDEALLLSATTINSLVSSVIADVGALYMASEAIALLDMLWSFAHSSILRNYVRPEFTGTLAVKAGRHPILERVQTEGSVIPNDVYCSNTSSFQLIQGANMSGKSTYLRQIALLCVMAMCGCFVPAEYASFRIHDALLTRLSNDDDIERNLSTFSSEMASSAMILGLMTSDSLVLIDELGRGTSPKEGVGFAHAIAEALIGAKEAFAFFATHFGALATTLSRHPSVVRLHLEIQKRKPSATNFGIHYSYKIIDGPPDEKFHYGLELSRLADLPEDVLVYARRVATNLLSLETSRDEQSVANRLAKRRKALLRLRSQIQLAHRHSSLSSEDFASYLLSFQRDIVRALGESLDES